MLDLRKLTPLKVRKWHVESSGAAYDELELRLDILLSRWGYNMIKYSDT